MGLFDSLTGYLTQMRELPELAQNEAEKRFPNSPRDSSDKNAFRHAAGTALLSQHLGGGALGSMASRLAGYGWEALGAKDFIASPQHREDTFHDINANAVGAKLSQQYLNRQDLFNALESYARQARIEDPRQSVTNPLAGYMTRSAPPTKL